jgi:ferric iron reductase protein FhuF
MGTYYEFGAHIDQNIGIVTNPNNALKLLQERIIDSTDENMSIAITVHELNDSFICNVWVTPYGQWLKTLPEQVVIKQPLRLVMASQVVRLINDVRISNYISTDLKWNFAFVGLQVQVQEMSAG